MKQIKFEIIAGVDGPCLAIDDHRVAGPKPWGGGTVKHSFTVRADAINTAIAPALIFTPDELADHIAKEVAKAREANFMEAADRAGKFIKGYLESAEKRKGTPNLTRMRESLVELLEYFACNSQGDIYCHSCSVVSGADRAIYHAPPVCKAAPKAEKPYEPGPESQATASELMRGKLR